MRESFMNLTCAAKHSLEFITEGYCWCQLCCPIRCLNIGDKVCCFVCLDFFFYYCLLGLMIKDDLYERRLFCDLW